MKIVLILTFLVSPLIIRAQQATMEADTIKSNPSDSLIVTQADTVAIQSYSNKYDPRRAMLLSAVLPGAGQVYNKKYWKVPFVVGGFYLIGIVMEFNQRTYKKYRGQLFSLLSESSTPVIVDRVNGITQYGNRVVGGTLVTPAGLGIDQVRSAVNKYRRDRDFDILLTFIWYTIQMMDAHVDAHLKEFDLNPALKVSIEPSMQNSYMTGRTSGFSINLKF